MPKKLFKRWMPNREAIQRQKALRIFGRVIYNPNLWCLNRRSAAGAFAVGLFIAFIPLPTQMLIAAGAAIVVGVNLPLSISLVWITNPVTMPVIFYGAYKVGSWVLHRPPHHIKFEPSWAFISEQMSTVGPPLLIGCILCGLISAIIGYFSIHWLWRYSVVRSWQKRRLR